MGAASSTPNASLSPILGPVPTPTTSITCPGSNNTVFASSKQQFRILCNTDFSGTQYGWSRGFNLTDCIKRCDTLPGCGAAAFVPTSSACYFKGADAKSKYAANVQGALLDRLVNGKSSSSSSSASKTTTVTTTITTTTGMPSRTSSSTSTTTTASRLSTSQSSSSLTTSSRQSSSTESKSTTQTITPTTLTTFTTVTTTTTTTSSVAPLPTSKSLTMLALGDSITSGYTATGAHNSYRLALMNMIMDSLPLWNVEPRPGPAAMYQSVGAVGGVHSGNFTSNNCEGYPAMQIDYIRSAWTNNSASYATTPNLVLVLAGINDVVQNVTDISTLDAVQRLGSFVDALNTAYPSAVVLVGTLTPVLINDWKPQVTLFNAAIPTVMRSKISSGKKIIVVDTFSALVADDIADWVHPTAQGYVKLASAFFGGVQSAITKGWLG